MPKLPPSGSWSGDWAGNKVPYGKHHAGRDRKPPKPPGKGPCRNKAVALLFWFSLSGTTIVNAMIQSF